jgi:hypothetical protein
MPLPVKVWTFPNVPPNPFTFATIGNLSPGKRTYAARDIGNLQPGLVMELLLPALTDVRGAITGNQDIVEVPAGSGRFYSVAFVDDVGKGFGNEYRFALIQQLAPWPVPTP